MEPEAIYVPSSLVFEINRLLSDSLSGSYHIGKENNVSSFHLLAEVIRVVVEAHPAAIVEQSEGFPELGD